MSHRRNHHRSHPHTDHARVVNTTTAILVTLSVTPQEAQSALEARKIEEAAKRSQAQLNQQKLVATAPSSQPHNGRNIKETPMNHGFKSGKR